MAVIRRYNRSQQASQASSDLIDTPDKLLLFARQKGLKLVPLDIEGVAKELNINLTRGVLPGDVSGILRKSPENGLWEILVNSKHHPNRQRYTIAHEVGHYCLHRYFQTEFEDKIFFRGGEASKEENQANSFASAILMPEESFKEKVRSGKNQVDELASEFGVSTLALRIRAKTLGMTGHGL